MPSDIVQSILDERGETTLAHYASEYYDPVKAKAYYERTKQLKGRKPATSKGQSQAIGFASKNIASARQTELKQLQAKREAQLKATSERIKKKLDDLIAKKADAILRRLEHMPPNADPDLIKKIMASNSKNANEARTKARNELAKSVGSIRKTFEKARADVNTKFKAAQATEERNIRANVR